MTDTTELKKVCPTCKRHSPKDKLWFMAWWSFCQTECKYMKKAKEK